MGEWFLVGLIGIAMGALAEWMGRGEVPEWMGRKVSDEPAQHRRSDRRHR
jgi:hypothetical protein